MMENEKMHLDSEYRKSGKFLDVLHPNYEEYGQSGKRYTKKDYEDIKLDSFSYEIIDYTCIPLSKEVRLCKYVLRNQSTHMETNRSSIWVMYQGDWKLIFHQGTKVEK